MKKTDFLGLVRQAQAPLAGMVALVPKGKIDWAPAPGFMTLGQVLHHLSENWCIVRMMVTAEWPFSGEEMEKAMRLENMPSSTPEEAAAAMAKDLSEGLAYMEHEISEADFFTKKVSAPWGFEGEIWKAVRMARDHQLNHKMQLHLYLKMLGAPVHTGTLYGM